MQQHWKWVAAMVPLAGATPAMGQMAFDSQAGSATVVVVDATEEFTDAFVVPDSGDFDLEAYVDRQPGGDIGYSSSGSAEAEQRLASSRLDLSLAAAAHSREGPVGHPDPDHDLPVDSDLTYSFSFTVDEATPFTLYVMEGLDNPLRGDLRARGENTATVGVGTAIIDASFDGPNITFDDPALASTRLEQGLQFSLNGYFGDYDPNAPLEVPLTGTLGPGTYTLSYTSDLHAAEADVYYRVYPTLIVPEPGAALAGIAAAGLMLRRRRY